MIKVQATINGIISKPATIRVSGDGKKFIGFLVKLSVPGSRNNMPGKELSISVSKDGDESELPSLAAGTRIEATGTLTFRKTGDNLYFNFHADAVNLSPESSKDAIEEQWSSRGLSARVSMRKPTRKAENMCRSRHILQRSPGMPCSSHGCASSSSITSKKRSSKPKRRYMPPVS